MIRVLIVDDHAVVRAGIRLLLDAESDLEPVGEAGDANEAVAQAAALTPDVVLLDVTMPGQSGVDAIPAVLAAAPGARVLMLSMHDDPAYARSALSAGASGYMLKEAAYVDLVAAIRQVAGGQLYVHPRMGAQLAVEPKLAEPADDLSEREREVLALLARGYTNQEIAARLFVSVRTVESHRSHILTKLRLSTRAELVRYALDTGLLQ
ncbi:MAG TPA: response regulator transcription factor [Thermoleophilia bacterium]|nr:response regulator transcription factor [Thermoleophilia bacterium]